MYMSRIATLHNVLSSRLPKFGFFSLTSFTLHLLEFNFNIIRSYHNLQERDGPQRTKSQTSHKEPRPTGTRHAPLCGQG